MSTATDDVVKLAPKECPFCGYVLWITYPHKITPVTLCYRPWLKCEPSWRTSEPGSQIAIVLEDEAAGELDEVKP